MENDLLRYKLNKYGYTLLIFSRDLAKFFQDYKSKEILELDYQHRHLLKFKVKNDGERKIRHPTFYGSKTARTILASFYVFGKNDFKSIKKERFLEEASNAFKDYCSLKKDELDENLLRSLKKMSVGQSEIRHLMNRNWFKRIFDVSEKEVKLKYPIKILEPKL